MAQIRKHEPSRWRKGATLGLAIVFALVLALIGLPEWTTARDETKRARARAEALRKELKALVVTEQKREEFARERQLLAEKIETLHRIVPREPSVDEFGARFREIAAEYQIEVLGWSSQAATAGPVLDEILVSFSLGGNVSRLRGLAERSSKIARLLGWKSARVDGGRALVALSIYTAPQRPTPKEWDSCVVPPSEVWLWPFASRVAAARSELEGLCAEREGHAQTRVQISEYLANKSRLQALVGAIEEVRARRKPPEIEGEQP